MSLKPTIGLEIHAELNTRSKMFCDCKNDPDEKVPNRNVCPICLAHPGVLPVINRSAIEKVLQMGLAVGGALMPRAKFDRKNYFYPDLPKNYQISQYDMPLVSGGVVNDVRLTRIHLEEDTGKLQHTKNNSSIVDFNRAGVPLLELVTEPEIKNSEQAVAFAKELRLILRYAGISEADMEKGNMRIEANISVSEDSSFGTKVEVKNINSFKAVGLAIEFEIDRQGKLLRSGEKIKQETRGWNDVKKVTESQRSKEEAHDYRYFPEPDLPPLTIDEFDLADLRSRTPELPIQKRQRFSIEFNLSEKNCELLIDEPKYAEFFESSVSELKTFTNDNIAVNTLFNYLTSDLKGLLASSNNDLGQIKFSAENFAHLIALLHKGKITTRHAKDVLSKMVEVGGDPENIIIEEGIELVSDVDKITATISKVIQSNPNAVADFKKGKENAVQFLVGQAMKELRGGVDAKLLSDSIIEELSK